MRFFFAFIVSFPLSVFGGVSIENSRLALDQELKVPAGSYTSFKLPLRAQSQLIAKFAIRGGWNRKIDVWLLDLRNFQRFQQGARFSYFKGTSGTVQQAAQYEFKVPSSGPYYLVFDNRKALLLPRTARVNVYIKDGAKTAKHKTEEKLYNGLYRGFLRKLFEFEDLQVTVRVCGLENAFSNPNITLCRELLDANERRGLPGANIDVFFHEAGHSLLKLWGYSLWDNEDAADEMATVLTLLIKKEEIALQAADWWGREDSREEALSKLLVDDRHTVSPQRARNIVRWVNQRQELLNRWQKIWIPHMTREALVGLRESREAWVDHSLVLAMLEEKERTSGVPSALGLSRTKGNERIVGDTNELLLGKWYTKDKQVPLSIQFDADYTWTAWVVGLSGSGSARGTWSLDDDALSASVRDSDIDSLPAGYEWREAIVRLGTSELALKGKSGVVQRYVRWQ